MDGEIEDRLSLTYSYSYRFSMVLSSLDTRFVKNIFAFFLLLLPLLFFLLMCLLLLTSIDNPCTLQVISSNQYVTGEDSFDQKEFVWTLHKPKEDWGSS